MKGIIAVGLQPDGSQRLTKDVNIFQLERKTSWVIFSNKKFLTDVKILASDVNIFRIEIYTFAHVIFFFLFSNIKNN